MSYAQLTTWTIYRVIKLQATVDRILIKLNILFYFKSKENRSTLIWSSDKRPKIYSYTLNQNKTEFKKIPHQYNLLKSRGSGILLIMEPLRCWVLMCRILKFLNLRTKGSRLLSLLLHAYLTATILTPFILIFFYASSSSGSVILSLFLLTLLFLWKTG